MKLIIRAFLRYKKSANRKLGADYNGKKHPFVNYFAQLSRKVSMIGWSVQRQGDTSVFRANPSSSTRRIIFYIHGGSFTAPTSTAHFRFCRELAYALDSEIVIIDYEVAPKVIYPSIHSQCRDLISTMVQNEDRWSEVVLAGDSAGAGIIPSIFSDLNQDVASLVKATVLMSPWIDYEGTSLSAQTRRRIDPWLNSSGVKAVALQYFRNIENIALVQAKNKVALDDQPPTFIAVGELEILFSDSLEIYTTLLANGILSSIYIGRSLWHVWPLFPITERKDFLREVKAFVEQVSDDNPR